MVLLTLVALLIAFGVAQRVLDRMRLTDTQALVVVAAIFFGGLIPDIPIGPVRVNVGGAIIPVALCVYLFVKAGTGKERLRAIVASLLSGAAVYLLGRLMPNEPEQIGFDPNYVYGLVAGAIAYLLGRSRRCAFIAGVLGVLLADTAVAVVNWYNGIDQPLVLGGGGGMDAVVISGLLAVLLAEFVGEAIERATTGKGRAEHEDGAIEGGRRRK